MSETHLYSLVYSKSGDAVFYSHLDTMRILERSIRRTMLEVSFTQGCNPHIRISLYSAIPLGVASNGEWFSMTFEVEHDPVHIRQKLNEQLPQGIRIIKCIKGKPAIEIEDEFELALLFSGSKDDAESVASALIALEKIEILGQRKKRNYTCDVRPFFENFTALDRKILFPIKNHGTGTPRIRDLMQALYIISKNASIDVMGIEIIHSSMKGAHLIEDETPK